MSDASLAQEAQGAAPLATLLLLARRAVRARSLDELRFIAVNETHQLTPYQQAVLWDSAKGIVALSGVASLEANAPYVLWLNRLLSRLHQTYSHEAPLALDAQHLTPEESAVWTEWLPKHALWLPLSALSQTRSQGGLLLAREEAWEESEIDLLSEWLPHLAQAFALRYTPSKWMLPLKSHPGKMPQTAWRNRYVIGGAILLAMLLMPVRLTVLASGELVPANPQVIRAPMDGVVERVLVMPNQRVTRDTPLLEFDRASIQSRLQVAQQSLATARAEYRQKAQQALFDSESRSKLAMLQGQIDERETEVAYLLKLEHRGVVTSPQDGIALFADPAEWSGRPVVTGERIMVVADQHDVEVEAWLAPADAIEFDASAPVKLYLNSSPIQPIVATLRYVAYQAEERPDGSYAYRLRARLVQHDQHPRIGLKGTAKLEGKRVSIAYWVMRRPLAAVRAWLGI